MEQETFEKIKRIYEQADSRGREIMEQEFPELAESEDEKIRRTLVEYFGPKVQLDFVRGIPIQKIRDWLEKQKEQKEELVYRLNGLMQDYIKEGKDDEEKEHRLKCYQLFWDALEDTNFFDQKEQKPIEPSDEELKRHQDELYDFRVFAAKQAKEHHISFVHDFEWNNFCAELLSYFHEQKPVLTAKEAWKEMRLEVYAQASGNRHEPNYSDDSTKMFSLCDIDEIFEKIGNSTVEQKPAEWSEEDENALKFLHELIGYGYVQKYMDAQTTHDMRKWVNEHLHPDTFQNGNSRPKTSDNWKPSEEQMKALQHAIDACESEWAYQDDELRSLLNDLKKL